MAAAKHNLPVGYRFTPSEQDLLSILDAKTKRNQLHPFYPIVERPIFGQNPPWEVFNDNDPWEYTSDGKSTKKTIFVYSKLVGLGKSRAVRRTSCGTWAGKSGTKIENSNEVVIGQMKYYKYEVATETKNKGSWMMHEYSFLKYKYGSVLCKITCVDGIDASATSYDTSTESGDGLLGKRKSPTTLDDGGSRKVCKGSGSWNGHETDMNVSDECGQVYDVSPDPLVGYKDDRTRGVLGCVTGMVPQVKEHLDYVSNDDLLKESYSATSFGYDISTTPVTGGIVQLQGIGELLPISDEGISKHWGGSGSGTERVIVTTDSDEAGKDNGSSGLWAVIDIGDDPLFQIPLISDETELLRYSWGVPDEYGLGDIGFVSSSDYLAQAEEMSAGGTRDYVTRSDLDDNGVYDKLLEVAHVIHS